MRTKMKVIVTLMVWGFPLLCDLQQVGPACSGTPENVTVVSGKDISLECLQKDKISEGMDCLEYRVNNTHFFAFKYKRPEPVDSYKDRIIASDYNLPITLTNVQPSDTGSYSCYISSCEGKVTCRNVASVVVEEEASADPGNGNQTQDGVGSTPTPPGPGDGGIVRTVIVGIVIVGSLGIVIMIIVYSKCKASTSGEPQTLTEVNATAEVNGDVGTGDGLKTEMQTDPTQEEMLPLMGNDSTGTTGRPDEPQSHTEAIPMAELQSNVGKGEVRRRTPPNSLQYQEHQTELKRSLT